MALANTGKAIGKATQLLSDLLNKRTNLEVTVGRPEPSNGTSPSLPQPRLNLFLYEAAFDPNMKNVPLDAGQQAPLWLTLRFLLTAFDDDGSSDTVQAHEYLGEGLRALQSLSFIPLDTLTASIIAALKDNPETLKITFEDAPSDLLARLMQGSDEKYRFSLSFQLRPVMIAPAEPPSYALLVGVDNTLTPADVIGDEGIDITVLPSMGPRLSGVAPAAFEIGDELTLVGSDLNLSGLSVRLGIASLPATEQQPNALRCTVDASVATSIAAGSQSLAAVLTLPNGRQRSSNLVVGALLPTVQTATTSGLHAVAGPPAGVAGNIQLTGALLGREQDDIFLALYRDGAVVKVYDAPFTFAPDQTALTLAIPDDNPVPSGTYRVILRINQQQARRSPEVTLTP